MPVAYLSERAGSLADKALDMHDRLVGEMLGKGEKARRGGKDPNASAAIMDSQGIKTTEEGGGSNGCDV